MLRPGPLPKHYQLSQILRQRILKGEYPPGSKIPGEWQLCQEYGLSRGTVRRAINTLLHEGLLRTEQGQGTYVVEEPWRSRPFLRLSNFNEEIARQHQQPKTTLLERRLLAANSALAHRLKVNKGEPIIYIARLRSINDQPIVYERRYLHQKLCPGLMEEDLVHQSIHQLLIHKYHLPLIRAIHTIEAHWLNEEEAALLKAHPGQSAFYIERLTYTLLEGHEYPAVWYLAIHLGKEYTFRIQQLAEEETQEIGGYFIGEGGETLRN